MSNVKSGIKNYQFLQKQIEQMQKAPKAVMKATMSDIYRRVPRWVAAEVAKVYGIDKKEIIPAELNRGKNDIKYAGTVRVEGKTIDGICIRYKGRVLTPTHFGMAPIHPAGYVDEYSKVPGKRFKLKKKKAAQAGAVASVRTPQPYDITVRIKKKKPKVLKGRYGTPPFLAPVKKGSTKMIPFQRKSNEADSPIAAIKTLSLPQMIDNETVSSKIGIRINDSLTKRVEHHLKRYMPGR